MSISSIVSKPHLTTIFSVLAMMAAAGCSDKDYYDPDFMQDQARDAFPVPIDKIDPNHTWETVTLRTVSVTVRLNLSESYDVALYTDDPLHTSANARLLATGTVADGGTASFRFDCPAALTSVFVTLTNAQGHALAYQAAFDETGHAKAVIGSETRADAATRATEAEAPEYAATCQDYLGSLTDADMKLYAAFTDADIDANNTFTNGIYDWSTNPPMVTYTVGDGHHLRVAEGTEITKTFHLNAEWGKVDDVVVYVEGTMHVNGNTFNGAVIVVAPTGHVIVEGNTQITNAGRFIVEAGGQITGADGVKLEVANSQRCYNAGTISLPGTLNVNGTDFYNCGNISVKSFEDTAGSGKITNFGRIVVDNNNADANAYNCTFVNACYLRFTGDAGAGSLTQLNNAYVGCGGKLTLSGTCTLGDKSLISTQDLQVNGTTFNGPTASGEYAVMQIKGNLYGGWGDAWVINGMTVVDWDARGVYVNGAWSDDDSAWSVLTGLKNHVTYWASQATTAVTVPVSDCGSTGNTETPSDGETEEEPGFEPTEPADLPTTTQAYTYLFEDMTDVAGDYDFNDCVFSVTTPVDGSLTLTLWAAGCTKTLDLCLKPTNGNHSNMRVLISDLARAFRTPTGQKSDGWIVNTETSLLSSGEIYCKPVTITVDNLPEGFTLAKNGDFFIADAYGQVHIPAFTEGFQPGHVPYALRVPGEWNWPIEYMPVTSVYFGFETWARNATAETDWYERGYAEDYVFPRSLLPE